MNFGAGKIQCAVAILAWMAVFGFLVAPANRMAAQDGEEPAASEAPSLAEQIAPAAAEDESGELPAAPLQEEVQGEEYVPESTQEPAQGPIQEEVQEEQSGDEAEEPSENVNQAKDQDLDEGSGEDEDNASTTAPLIIADSQETSIIDESAEVAGEQDETESESPQEETNINKLKERIKYKQFRQDQNPEFVFSDLEDRRNFFKKIIDWMAGKKRQTRIQLIDPAGEISDADVFARGQEIKINQKHYRQFRPGLYQLKAIVTEGDRVTEEIQEFEWGVLTANTDKTIYQPNDIANLYFGVLDSSGHTICDAAISIKITDPQGSVSYLGGNPSGECGNDNITDIPDYSAIYQTTIPGKYEVEVVANNANGARTC